jgi:hypothetical protein
MVVPRDSGVELALCAHADADGSERSNVMLAKRTPERMRSDGMGASRAEKRNASLPLHGRFDYLDGITRAPYAKRAFRCARNVL